MTRRENVVVILVLMECTVRVELLYGGEDLLALVPVFAWHPLLSGLSIPVVLAAPSMAVAFAVSRELGCDELCFLRSFVAVVLVSFTLVVVATVSTSRIVLGFGFILIEREILVRPDRVLTICPPVRDFHQLFDRSWL
jgi:hypothetical protein